MLKICFQRIFNYCKLNSVNAELSYKSTGKVGFIVKGDLASLIFKDESGKHVVQRCPPTENKGRRHTSTVAVSVLPILMEEEFSLLDKDIEVTTQRGHGPGGQHQNTTDSAVRMVHKPTGVMVFINGKDQYSNKRAARRILESRIAEIASKKKQDKHSKAKREQS